MTEISEAAMAKACELVNASRPETASPSEVRDLDFDGRWSGIAVAFARYIQHVSDVCREVKPNGYTPVVLEPFILPNPPDPLYEALFEVVSMGRYDTREQCELLRGELERRGFTIAPVQS